MVYIQDRWQQTGLLTRQIWGSRKLSGPCPSFTVNGNLIFEI